jgi:hypothetical protein
MYWQLLTGKIRFAGEPAAPPGLILTARRHSTRRARGS